MIRNPPCVARMCDRSTHIDQDGSCSINIEILEDHINALFAFETVSLVLRRFEFVFPYFELVFSNVCQTGGSSECERKLSRCSLFMSQGDQLLQPDLHGPLVQ